MLAIERQSRIVQLISERQTLSVAELATMFDVSDMTIRRDLVRLEERGILQRTHGGASILKRPTGDHPYYARVSEQVQEKAAIARLAAARVQAGETIVLDAGTTIARLASLLVEKRDLTVITNSLHVVSELQHAPGINLIVTGGTLWEPTMSLVGPVAISTLHRFAADTAFLATPALSLEAGITNSNLYEAEVKATMIEIARETVLLADHTKFGRTSYAKVAPLTALHCLITDDRTPPATLQRVREQGVEVLVAAAAGAPANGHCIAHTQSQ
jgi:DeoR/GlpR family transcriptional regulator of sugar metabolism